MAADFLNDLSNRINEFFERPEVKEAINKAKVTTVNIAEKGVENLKKALNTEGTLNQTSKEETPAEENKTEE